MVKIIPSLFAANLYNLEQECQTLKQNGFDLIHVDMMDGHFVDHISFGTSQIKELKNHIDRAFDVHMMVSNPEKNLKQLLKSDIEYISFHYEATPHVQFMIDEIKKHNKKVGIAINPATNPSVLKSIINDLDYILILSINPGREGQKFRYETLNRIKEVKELVGERKIEIEVDGGIDFEIAKQCKKAGATMIVIGSYLFKKNFENLKKLKNLEE
ncbi:ribulose-phosphate 3-epimerase (plasmid) [Staphylococcus pseudoxylosus]|uniref:ribulose-phosphate 3-epimerase n=1 Tax=Staphylococcus pseudoxylosus TaxID=2282419 RepID=UPI0034D181C5